MRKFISHFTAFCGVSIILFACQKETSSVNFNEKNKFDAGNIKEWYYSTFKKSSEWSTSNLKGKKLPDWKHSVFGKIGTEEVIEFPLSKATSSFSIASELSSYQRTKILEASISKILFFKKPNGGILVREINYIPDWEYLIKNNYDISHVSVLNLDNDFSGRIIIKRWDDSEISSTIFQMGRIIKTGHKQKKNTNNNLLSNSFGDGCTTTEFCIWQTDCTITIYGDGMVTDECEPPYNTGECWTEEYCPDPPDDCEMYGTCNGPNDPPPCTQQKVDDAIGSVSASSLSIKESIQTVSSNATSITRNYKWKFAKVENGLGLGINFFSHETGIQNQGNDGWWRWTSFVHNNESQSGGAIFWDAEVNSMNATPIINNIEVGGPINVTVSFGGMQLNWRLKVSYTCGAFLGSSYPSGSTSNTWYTYEQ